MAFRVFRCENGTLCADTSDFPATPGFCGVICHTGEIRKVHRFLIVKYFTANSILQMTNDNLFPYFYLNEI